MEGYEPIISFGEEAAAAYDAQSTRGDEAATVSLLAELAGSGPVLELAIGTGRIALPLAATGLQVDGIDLSPAMVEQLRAKPGGTELSVTIGDIADVPVPGTYRLVYLVFNTIFNLLRQGEQLHCFENVARRLTDDGSFVVEANVPSYLQGLHGDQHVEAEMVGGDAVVLDVGQRDSVHQLHYENHVVLSRAGARFFPIVTRYAWPSELDLMARAAGLRLRDRWGGWNREPFDAHSRRHVSVYSR